jgi:hypothetical protein
LDARLNPDSELSQAVRFCGDTSERGRQARKLSSYEIIDHQRENIVEFNHHISSAIRSLIDVADDTVRLGKTAPPSHEDQQPHGYETFKRIVLKV